MFSSIDYITYRNIRMPKEWNANFYSHFDNEHVNSNLFKLSKRCANLIEYSLWSRFKCRLLRFRTKNKFASPPSSPSYRQMLISAIS